MRIAVVAEGPTVQFLLQPEAGDPKETRHGATLARQRVEVQLPAVCSAERTHPDLMALAAILAVGPFSGKQIELSTPVSHQFAAAVASGLRKRIGPVDPELEPRRPRPDAGPGLCYSGGVDSTAALDVMPASTQLVFLERVAPPGVAWTGGYDKASALHACQRLQQLGRQVHVVPTDLEFVRAPTGFPDHLSNALPLVLLADAANLDSCGWGTIAESAYRYGTTLFADYAHRAGPTWWRNVFAAAGLGTFNAVAGVSEVGTSMIARRSSYGDLAQSCMRGDVGAPCRRCRKCFRKLLLNSAISGDWPPDDELDRMLANDGVRRHLDALPMKHESVFTYSLSRYPGSHPLMRLLQRRVRADVLSPTWLERWYEPSVELVPAAYRDPTRAALSRHLSPMDADDEAQMRAWDAALLGEDPTCRLLTRQLGEALSQHASRGRRAARPGQARDVSGHDARPLRRSRVRLWLGR